MSQETQTLYFNQNVKASPSQVYYAFTNAGWQRLCNVFRPCQGGGGSQAGTPAITWLAVYGGRPAKVPFWHGRNEPGTTRYGLLADQMAAPGQAGAFWLE
jgi:hypothetical protein